MDFLWNLPRYWPLNVRRLFWHPLQERVLCQLCHGLWKKQILETACFSTHWHKRNVFSRLHCFFFQHKSFKTNSSRQRHNMHLYNISCDFTFLKYVNLYSPASPRSPWPDTPWQSPRTPGSRAARRRGEEGGSWNTQWVNKLGKLLFAQFFAEHKWPMFFLLHWDCCCCIICTVS